MTDSYKASHYRQLPHNTEHSFSYIESRGGQWDRTLFFGLQMFLKEYMTKAVTMHDIEEADDFFSMHGVPFNREGWVHIVRHHHGRLPVSIRAVAEGTVVANHNVLATIVNTDPRAFWLPSYLETALLRAVWYGSTVATNSLHCKLAILNGLRRTSDDPQGQIGFKLHDFGARGVSSHESAAIGGAAHLVNFQGSDTVEGIMAARRYYGETCAGFSIPAAEHSTITAWGRDGETAAYRNMLRQFGKPNSMLAVVSDSYDLDNAVNAIWGETLRQSVIDSGATVVIRPDSGDPEVIPVRTVAALAEKFGTTLNGKGFKVLPPCVRVLQGDGIDEAAIAAILHNLEVAGFSADNISFGMGGGLLQAVNRDTLRFAMKCSAVEVRGVWRDVFKDPVTDPGKRSKKGRLALVASGEGHETVPLAGNEDRNLLGEVFRDGRVTTVHPFSAIRHRAASEAFRLIGMRLK